MKKILILLFFLGCTTGHLRSNPIQKIISEARNMADMLLQKNFVAYGDYLYPGIVAMAGSKKN
jgi:energy-converting hydrogenase Eha subunit C